METYLILLHWICGKFYKFSPVTEEQFYRREFPARAVILLFEQFCINSFEKAASIQVLRLFEKNRRYGAVQNNIQLLESI